VQKQNIRIVQLIDSLEPGGAERMAVTYANALVKQLSFSGLVATRKEGLLKGQLDDTVTYAFLNKQRQLDFKALWRLRQFCKQYQVEYIHAHSSSFFWAVLVKLTLPKIKVIWHDHYGNSEFLAQRNPQILAWCSYCFSAILVVNEQLKQWSERFLHCSKVAYLPNFVSESNDTLNKTTFLKGENGKRIVLLANLRQQKNHFFLVQIAQQLKESHPDWTFHLVGKDFHDSYSAELKEKIIRLNLSETVYLYGSKEDIPNILQQAAIGILTSRSEGLPVALLEYGINSLPIVTTAVGEIPQIIKNESEGFLVEVGDLNGFVNSLKRLMGDSELRIKLGNHFKEIIEKNYTETAVFKQYFSLIDESRNL